MSSSQTYQAVSPGAAGGVRWSVGLLDCFQDISLCCECHHRVATHPLRWRKRAPLTAVRRRCRLLWAGLPC